MNLDSVNFNCVSLNVRGLNQSNKRRKIFRWLHQQNAPSSITAGNFQHKRSRNQMEKMNGAVRCFIVTAQTIVKASQF